MEVEGGVEQVYQDNSLYPAMMIRRPRTYRIIGQELPPPAPPARRGRRIPAAMLAD